MESVNYGCQDAAQKESQVNLELARLSNTIQQAGKGLEVLEHRLEKVLMPEPEVNEKKACDRPTMVPLAESIGDCADQVGDISARIASLLIRLEL